MKYILKSKDTDVLTFTIKSNGNTPEIDEIVVANQALLPRTIHNTQLKESLTNWINKRRISKSRLNARQILSAINNMHFLSYIDVGLGLSLIDTYWVIPVESDYKWKDYNLYQHDFNEAIGRIGITGKEEIIGDGLVLSPDFTTDGMLQKCWCRDNGQINLYKGSYIHEAYAEFYHAQIAEIMGFDFVSYDITEKYGHILSSCSVFTCENEGYIPMSMLMSDELEKDSALQQKICSEIYGKEAFEDLMVFDSLICNIDRHTGNFGMIVDNDTKEILRSAPIFDNGMGMFGWLTKDTDFEVQYDTAWSYFNMRFDEQLKIYVRPRHAEGLEKLRDFVFERHPKYNLCDEFLEFFERKLQEKINVILDNYLR